MVPPALMTEPESTMVQQPNLIGSLLIFAAEMGSLDMPDVWEDRVIERVEGLVYNISLCSAEEKLMLRNEAEKLIQQYDLGEGMIDFLRALVDSVTYDETE
jgi:hypothetical protein